jgi:hypothetical protein
MNLLKIPCSDDPASAIYVQPERISSFAVVNGETRIIIPDMLPIVVEGDITKQLADTITKGTGGKLIHI